MKSTALLLYPLLAVGVVGEDGSRQEAKKNLLLIFMDQWRWDWAGFNDAQVRCPNIAELASNGVRFSHAFTPAPLCAPARGALGSGMEYDDSPVPDNGIDYPVDGSHPTYYSLLQKAGYHVMVAGKDHLTMSLGVGVNGSIHAEKLGFDDWQRMPDKYETFKYSYPYDQFSESLATYDNGSLYNVTADCYGSFGEGNCCDSIDGLEGGAFCPRPQPAGPGDIVYPDNWTEAAAETLFDRRPVGKPWFMQVGFPGPHPPFVLTEAMNKSVAGRTYPSPQGSGNYYGNEFYQTMRRQYAAEIENLDNLVGKLLHRLESSGQLTNTVIAVAADHGEMLGDYNKYAKSMPWDGSARVPLIFKGPGIQVGKVSSIPATTLDIVGTFLDIAGAKATAKMTTQSMWPFLSFSGTPNKGTRDFISSGLGSETFIGEYDNEVVNSKLRPPPGGRFNWRMVVKQMNATSTLKLICCPTGCNAINGNSTLFPNSRSAQVGLFEISGDRLEVDLLNQGKGRAEASELIMHLPSVVHERCKKALDAGVSDVIV